MVRDFPIVSEYSQTPGPLREVYPNVRDFFRNISVPFDSLPDFLKFFVASGKRSRFQLYLGHLRSVRDYCINLKYFIAK